MALELLPAKPNSTDYEVAKDIMGDLLGELRGLRESTTDAAERAKLDRQIKLYFRERRELQYAGSAYQRTRTRHVDFYKQLFTGAAVEDGKIRRPFKYGQHATPLPV